MYVFFFLVFQGGVLGLATRDYRGYCSPSRGVRCQLYCSTVTKPRRSLLLLLMLLFFFGGADVSYRGGMWHLSLFSGALLT